MAGGPVDDQAPSGGAPAPPGWYPDPQTGQQRYWDGTSWAAGHAPVTVAPRGPMTDSEARQWAMGAHLSALASMFIGIPLIGPLLIYLIKKDDHPFVADQAREAVNFNLSFLLYEVVTGFVVVLLTIVIIGIFLIPIPIAIAVAWAVLAVVAGIKANQGEAYRYPMTIRFIS